VGFYRFFLHESLFVEGDGGIRVSGFLFTRSSPTPRISGCLSPFRLPFSAVGFGFSPAKREVPKNLLIRGPPFSSIKFFLIVGLLEVLLSSNSIVIVLLPLPFALSGRISRQDPSPLLFPAGTSQGSRSSQGRALTEALEGQDFPLGYPAIM